MTGDDFLTAVATELRGSDRFLEALLRGQLYVIGLRSGGDPDAYARLVHHEDGAVVWPLFSSWETASTFIRRCGVQNTDQFLLVPADQFLTGYDCATTRVFLNPRTPHQRELWPEEAKTLQEDIQGRASRRTTG